MCTITRPDVPIVPAFLNAKCQDLTPYLAGDAVRDYPNLAALPSRSWKSTLINGKIYGVPIPLKPYFWWFWVHQEILDQMGLNYPTSAAEFKEIALKVRNPSSNLWAIASNGGSQYAFDTVQGLWNAVFEAPNYWAVDSAGKFTYMFETEEYKQAMAYAADLVKADLYHPSSLTYNVNSGRGDFRARKFVFREDGLQNQFGAYWGGINAVPMEPPSRITMVPPFSADGKKKPVYYFGRPNFGMALVKQADDARVKEMLRILNYLAAPFGSIEGHLLRYGVEGTDYKYDDNGNPQINERGKAEIQAWGSLTSSSGTGGGGEVWYSPQEPDYVPVLQSYERILGPLGVEDASIGTFSQTFASKGTLLLDGIGGGAQDIIAGRRPIADFNGLVQEWRNGGGTQIKEELAQSYAQLMKG
jgi:putative aldouronate transport system substrate-binding protein